MRFTSDWNKLLGLEIASSQASRAFGFALLQKAYGTATMLPSGANTPLNTASL